MEITDIRNNKGQIQLQVYKDETSFNKAIPWKNFYIKKSEMNGNKIVYKISDLPKGTYGIALLDDENKNEKMDYSFLLPKEGFGFADYYHTGWSQPKFDDFKFVLNENKRMEIKIRYVK